jgi:hypothetical protein
VPPSVRNRRATEDASRQRRSHSESADPQGRLTVSSGAVRRME